MILIFSLFLTLYSCNNEKSRGEEVPMKLESLDWIVGSWQDNVNVKQWEIWEKKENGFFGRGMFIKNKDTSFFEEMTISLENDKLIFIATVKKNTNPVKFVATRSMPNQIVFENPQHDFPQYISYKYRSEEDMLQADVKGGEKGFTALMFRR